MDATCKVQDNIHVFRLVHNMCPGFWVHIRTNGPISFRDLFHIPFYVRKAFKIKGLKELRKIKWFIRNLKRRNFHSTSTEDGIPFPFLNCCNFYTSPILFHTLFLYYTSFIKKLNYFQIRLLSLFFIAILKILYII